MGAPDLKRCVGRLVERNGCLTPELAGMLGAALGHSSAPKCEPEFGDTMPPLWHWSAFPEFVPLSGLGADGHPELGEFLPDVGLPRRMWAGGTLSFTGGLKIGEPLRRRSEIAAVEEKTGVAGRMVFVTVAHVIDGEDGGRIDERQDIVYLAIPDEFRAPKKTPIPDTYDFSEEVIANEVRLFRYSAATFNAHRIHYDLNYAQSVEKYPALVVHAPMQAQLLIESGIRNGAHEVERFRFRGVHPMFHNHGLRLIGRGIDDGNSMELCTAAPDGFQGLQARIDWK